MGINISYHDDSPFTKVSPGVKCFSTPSEFHGHKPYGMYKKLFKKYLRWVFFCRFVWFCFYETRFYVIFLDLIIHLFPFFCKFLLPYLALQAPYFSINLLLSLYFYYKCHFPYSLTNSIRIVDY